MEKLREYYKEVRGELRKVTWTGRKEVKSGTLAVLLLCLIIGLFLTLCDAGLSQFFQWILNI